MPHPEFLPSPLRDRVGYFHHDRFRAILPFTVVPACNLPVYASQWPLPDITQDLVRGCELEALPRSPFQQNLWRRGALWRSMAD